MEKTLKKIIAVIAVSLVLFVGIFMLTGCIESEYSLVETRLETSDFGYSANSAEVYGITGCSHRIKADKGTKGTQSYEFVHVLYFETEDAAIDYFKDILNGYAWTALEDEIFYDGLTSRMRYERVFNIVIIGTKQAVKDVLN